MSFRTTAGTAAAAIALAAAPLAAQGTHPAAGHAQPPAPSRQARAPLSPRDTAEATIAGAQVVVDYSRPSKRGRQVVGGLVPLNAVWRTGADAATTLITSQPLRMGNTTVPAGTYTLYSLRGPSDQWTLIVNRQTGQWGTEYNQAQDLARIPMRVKPVASPVEQFTIAVEPGRQNGGVLALTWDTTRGEVPFTVVR